MVPTGGETSGSVLGPVAAFGKQRNWGLKQKRVSPRSGRPALPEASSSFWWSQASLGLWSHPSSLCLHCYVASSCVCVCVPTLRRTNLWVWSYPDNPG